MTARTSGSRAAARTTVTAPPQLPKSTSGASSSSDGDDREQVVDVQAPLDRAVVLVDRRLGHVGLGLAEAAQIGPHHAVPCAAEEVGQARHRAERARTRQRAVGSDHDRAARMAEGSCAVHTISAPSAAATTKARRLTSAPRPARRPRTRAPRASLAPAGAGGGTGRTSRGRCAARSPGRPRSRAARPAGCRFRPRQSAGGKRSPSSTIGWPASRRATSASRSSPSSASAPRRMRLAISPRRSCRSDGAHVEAGVDQQERIGGGRLHGGERGNRAVAHREHALMGFGEAPGELVQAVADVGHVRRERRLLEHQRALAAAARVEQQRAVAGCGERAHEAEEHATGAHGIDAGRRDDEHRATGVGRAPRDAVEGIVGSEEEMVEVGHAGTTLRRAAGKWQPSGVCS